MRPRKHCLIALVLGVWLTSPATADEIVLVREEPVVLSISAGQPLRLLLPESLARGSSWVLTLEERAVDLKARRLAADGAGDELWQASPLLRVGQLYFVFPGRDGVEIQGSVPDATGEVRAVAHAVANTAPELEAFLAMQSGGRHASEETRESRLAAVEAYGRAESLWSEIGHERLRVEALESRAILLRKLGDMPGALPEQEELVRLWRRLGDTARTANAVNDLGLTLRDLGRLDEARAALEEAFELYRRHGDTGGEGSTRNNLCMLDHANGALREAIGCYRSALELFQDAGKAAEEAAVLNNLGFAWDGLGEPTEARRAYRRALEIRRRLGDRRAEAQQLNNLGLIDRRSGNFTDALERYLEALALFEELGDLRRLASVRNNLGIVYFGLGDLAKARDFYEEALELRRRTGDRRGELISLNNLGSVLGLLGEWPRALEAHHQALDIARDLGQSRLEWETLRRLGRGALAADRPEVALESLTKAAEGLRTSQHRLSAARAEQALGEVYLELGRRNDSRAALERARASLQNLGEPVEEATTLATLARWERTYGELDEALRLVGEAFDQLETIRARLANPRLGASLLGRSDLWSLRIELLMERHAVDPEAGFDQLAVLASEAFRAHSLRQLNASSSASASSDVPGEVPGDSERPGRNRREELAQRFAAKAERLLRLADRDPSEGEVAALEGELAVLGAELDRLESQSAAQEVEAPALERLEQLQELLDPHTHLVSYSLGASRSHGFHLTADGLRTFPLPPRARLEAMALEVYADLSSLGNEPQAEAERNRDLARLLLGPVLGKPTKENLESDGPERLAIVADGALHFLPFAALRDPRHPEQPLVERVEVVHLPSASVLSLQRSRSSGSDAGQVSGSAPTLALLADPVFQARDPRLPNHSTAANGEGAAEAGSSLDRLPSTRREAENIAALLPESRVFLALDGEATRERMLGPHVAGARYVHLATHGIFDASRPELSGLALSGFDPEGRPVPSFVSLRDLQSHRLAAELVTLSACRSALGRQVRGEGLLGLTHAFLRAGAARVLSSLWQVRDRGTTELMLGFYRGVWTESLPPAAALRQAQRELRSRPRYRDPYYWSAFVLQGDWR